MNIKGYLMIITDLVILTVPFLDEINGVVKLIAGLCGIVLTIYAIWKIRLDIQLNTIKRQQEEERLRILQNSDEL